MTVNESTSAQILNLIGERGARYFHDQTGRAYIQVSLMDHEELFKCPSTELKNWLSHEFFKTFNRVASDAPLKDALRTLTGIAMYEGQEVNMSKRVAAYDCDLWYDLCDKKKQAIRITRNGWSIVTNPPPIFCRSLHQAQQVLPGGKGDFSLIDRYLNIQSEEEQLLLKCTILSYFIPDIAHQVLVLHGPQGSAKTTTVKLLRTLVDPSRTPTLALPRSDDQLIHQLFHHWTLVFDNISRINHRQSDLLCSAVTGDSNDKRMLYTDDDQVTYSYKPCIILAGINVVPTSPDLLDRSILVRLRRFDSAERKDDSKLLSGFESDRSLILAGIFDTLSRARSIRENLPSGNRYSRMADAEAWGRAFSEALGYSQELYLKALRNNEALKNAEVVYSNPVAESLTNFMAKKSFWEGTPTELYTLLKPSTIISRRWPGSPHALSRELNKCVVNLEREGILVKSTRSATERKVTIRKKTVGGMVDQLSHRSIDQVNETGATDTSTMTPMTLFD